MTRRPMDEDYVDIDTLDNNQEESLGNVGYSWESKYVRTWEDIQEDSEGRLSSVVSYLQQQQQRRRQRLLKDTVVIQRGIIRHMFLIIDASEAMNDNDLRPTRMDLTVKYAQQFVQEFFDQNPISQLGIIVMREGLAEKLTELSGNPSDHENALKSKENMRTEGEPSLQNALQLARASMAGVPSHGSKEIMMIFGSLTTCDPGDIYETIELLRKDMIRVSVVGLSAEVHICRVLSQKTKGTYGIAVDEAHYKELVFDIIPPPATVMTNKTSSLVTMGFPRRTMDSQTSLCVCHSKLTLGGYICPRCASKVCDLPSDCDVCGLTLVSSPHLARSYHHLFPVVNFTETANASIPSSTHCFSCQTSLLHPEISTPQSAFKCPNCQQCFCIECDNYIHEVLHNCPGCWSGYSTPTNKNNHH